ncbi:3504_t:CDS:2, partial [Racocetra persica]
PLGISPTFRLTSNLLCGLLGVVKRQIQALLCQEKVDRKKLKNHLITNLETKGKEIINAVNNEILTDLNTLIKTGEKGEQGLIADYEKKKKEIIGQRENKGTHQTARTVGFSIYSFVPIAGGGSSTLLINELSDANKKLQERYTEKEVNQIADNIAQEANKFQIEARNKLIRVKEKYENLIKASTHALEAQNKKLEDREREINTLKTDGENTLKQKAQEYQNQIKKQKETLTREKSELEKQINNLISEKQIITNNYNQVAKKCQEYERIAAETAERINNQTLLPDPKDLDLHK